jgi:hypothetical protein
LFGSNKIVNPANVPSSVKNLASKAPSENLPSNKNNKENNIRIINNNYQEFEQDNFDQVINFNKNLNHNKNQINKNQLIREEEDFVSNNTPSLQSPSNINLKTYNEMESNYSKRLNSNINPNNPNNHHNQNTFTNPNLPNNNYPNTNNNQNWMQNNNNSNNANNVYSTNSNDVSKTSYEIIAENNLRRSGSKFKKSVASNNRSISRPKKEIYSSDSAAASRINFEKSLRSYGKESLEANNAGINILNTSGNINKRIFNNYLKNKGNLFDEKILRRYDAKYECRKKSNSKTKNQISNLFQIFLSQNGKY